MVNPHADYRMLNSTHFSSPIDTTPYDEEDTSSILSPPHPPSIHHATSTTSPSSTSSDGNVYGGFAAPNAAVPSMLSPILSKQLLAPHHNHINMAQNRPMSSNDMAMPAVQVPVSVAAPIIPLATYNSNDSIQIQESANKFLKKLDRELPSIFSDRIWRDSILDYERLKKHLKNVLHWDREERLSAVTDEDNDTRSSASHKKHKPHELFWCVIRAEVDKCNTFILTREDEITALLDTISITAHLPLSDPKPTLQLEHCCRQLDSLAKYILISYIALFKLVRAYDYHTRSV